VEEGTGLMIFVRHVCLWCRSRLLWVKRQI